jgi:hypothetical protein
VRLYPWGCMSGKAWKGRGKHPAYNQVRSRRTRTKVGSSRRDETMPTKLAEGNIRGRIRIDLSPFVLLSPAVRLYQSRKALERRRPVHGKTPQRAGTVILQIAILFLAAVVVTRSMWTTSAMLAGHEAGTDLARLVEFNAAIRAGDFFPTWSPDLYSGYGSPIFQFYAPLAYYAAEVPVLIGFNYVEALKITQLLALFASALAMYLLASSYFSGWAPCVGGVFYMLAPYRLVDMFVRHALAEHFAFIWLPFIAWGTARFVAASSPTRFCGFATGALTTAALILTHNVMALIALPICVAVGWVLAWAERARSLQTRIESARPQLDRNQTRQRLEDQPAKPNLPKPQISGSNAALQLAMSRLARAGAIAALGLGLTTFFWWPAISGRSLTLAEASLTTGYYDFHRHFVQGWQFLNTGWSFGISGGRAGKQMPLQIGLPHLLAGLGALAMIVSRRQGEGEAGRQRAVWSFVGVCIMAGGVFMCCRWSQPLWESLPLVKYVQFPWRFLGLVVFGSAMCATALFNRFAAGGGRFAIMASLAGILAVLAAYFPYYSQAFFFVGDARSRSIVRVSGAEVHTIQSARALIPFGLSTTPTELRQMHLRATGGDDFLPRDVKEKPGEPPTQMVQAVGGRVVEFAHLNQNRYRSRVQMSVPGKAELLQFWFPGWQASVDGTPVKTAPSGPQAIVSCDLPAGDHVVEFTYRGPPQRSIGIIISIVSGAIGACALAFLPLRQYKGQAVGNR